MRARGLLVAVAALLLLVAEAGASDWHLQTAKCADLSVLKQYGEFSSAMKLMRHLQMLPHGIPHDATLFLPSNEAINWFLASPGIPLPAHDVDSLINGGLAPEIGERLITIFLYHLLPTVGPLESKDLPAAGPLDTALPGYTLTVTDHRGEAVVTDAQGGTARVAKPHWACSSAIYGVDRVLMPAAFEDIAQVTPEDAKCFVTGEDC